MIFMLWVGMILFCLLMMWVFRFCSSGFSVVSLWVLFLVVGMVWCRVVSRLVLILFMMRLVLYFEKDIVSVVLVML